MLLCAVLLCVLFTFEYEQCEYQESGQHDETEDSPDETPTSSGTTRVQLERERREEEGEMSDSRNMHSHMCLP